MKAFRYKNWLVNRKQGKFCAYDFTKDIFLNPIYDTWKQLKDKIDAIA